jgi:probable blue pigment (indigoidine) exporter
MSLLSPVTAVVLGWIFLGQKIQGMALVGLIVVLASVLSIQRAGAPGGGSKTKKPHNGARHCCVRGGRREPDQPPAGGLSGSSLCNHSLI